MTVARRGTQKASATATGGVSSLSVSFPGAATAGDAVLVGVTQFISGGPLQPGTTAVADNQTGNTYTRDAIGSGLASGGDRCGIYSAFNVNATGTFTVTFTPSTNNGASNIGISEYSGVASTHAAALDVTAAGGTASTVFGPFTTSTTAATAQGDEVAVAMFTGAVNPPSITASAPFSNIASNVSVEEFCFADRITTVTGTQQCSWTNGNNSTDSYDACIATYKGAAAATTQQMTYAGMYIPNNQVGPTALRAKYRQSGWPYSPNLASITNQEFSLRVILPHRFVGPPVLRLTTKNRVVFDTDVSSAPGVQTVLPSAILSSEAFGTLRILFTLYPSGVATSESFGVAKINFTLYPAGVTTSELFGTGKYNFTVYPVAVATQEAFGTGVVHIGGLSQTIFVTGIVSAEALGFMYQLGPDYNLTQDFSWEEKFKYLGEFSLNKIKNQNLQDVLLELNRSTRNLTEDEKLRIIHEKMEINS